MKVADGKPLENVQWKMAIHDDGTVSFVLIVRRKRLSFDREKTCGQVINIQESTPLHIDLGAPATIRIECSIFAELSRKQLQDREDSVLIFNAGHDTVNGCESSMTLQDNNSEGGP